MTRRRWLSGVLSRDVIPLLAILVGLAVLALFSAGRIQAILVAAALGFGGAYTAVVFRRVARRRSRTIVYLDALPDRRCNLVIRDHLAEFRYRDFSEIA